MKTRIPIGKNMKIEEAFKIWDRWQKEWLELREAGTPGAGKVEAWVIVKSKKRQNNCLNAVERFKENVMCCALFYHNNQLINLMIYPDLTAKFITFIPVTEIRFTRCQRCGTQVPIYEWMALEPIILCNFHIRCHNCSYVGDTGEFIMGGDLLKCPKCGDEWGDGGG